MPATPPKVQIFCISYMHEKFIGQALESFVCQETNFPFEVIVADDFSPDTTQDIIRDYQSKYPEIIKPILRKANIGAELNYIYTANILTAEYVAICEGDDYWTDPKKLQKQVDALETHSNCTVCFHPVLVKWEDGSQENTIFPDPEYHFNKAELTIDDLLIHNFISTNSVMYRWQFKNGSLENIFPKDILPGDWYLHLLQAKKGNILFLDECMSVYRRHAGGIWTGCGITDDWFCRCGIKHLRFLIKVKENFCNTENIYNYSLISGFISKIIDSAKRQNRKDILKTLRLEFYKYYYEIKINNLHNYLRENIWMKYFYNSLRRVYHLFKK